MWVGREKNDKEGMLGKGGMYGVFDLEDGGFFDNTSPESFVCKSVFNRVARE